MAAAAYVNSTEVARIHAMRKEGLSYREIGRLVGRDKATVSRALNGTVSHGIDRRGWVSREEQYRRARSVAVAKAMAGPRNFDVIAHGRTCHTNQRISEIMRTPR